MKSNSTEYLPPIFVLTLPGSDRSAKLQTALLESGANFELFYGVDGRKGLPEIYEKSIDRANTESTFGREMNDAEYACSLSHLQIYQTILDRGLDKAIIFEDDAIPHKMLFKLDDRFFNAADLILLFHYNTYVNRFDFREGQSFATLRLRNSPFMACSYVISAVACEYILKRAYPVASHPDWPVDLTRINAVAAWPFLASHDASLVSDLSPGRQSNRRRKINLDYIRRKYLKLTGKKIA